MNNEYWVKLTKRMNFQKYTKYTKYYNKLLNIVLSEKFEWFKKIELNDIQVGNIYESKNLIPIGKIYVDSIWGYNQWKEYHYDSSFPTDEEVSFGDIIGGDLSKEIQEQFKLCFSQIIGSLKPKYMCFSWLEMVLVEEDDNKLQENISRIREMMGLITEMKSKKQFIQIFADGGGSDFADKYDGPSEKISVKDTIPNEPFKDTSYMETSDNIRNMIKSINNGEELPPIKVIQHPYDETKYVVVDGNHRRYAYTKSDVNKVDAIIIPHKDVILMKSKWGEESEELGRLSEFSDNTKIVNKYFVKPDGTNDFKTYNK